MRKRHGRIGVVTTLGGEGCHAISVYMTSTGLDARYKVNTGREAMDEDDGEEEFLKREVGYKISGRLLDVVEGNGGGWVT